MQTDFTTQPWETDWHRVPRFSREDNDDSMTTPHQTHNSSVCFEPVPFNIHSITFVSFIAVWDLNFLFSLSIAKRVGIIIPPSWYCPILRRSSSHNSSLLLCKVFHPSFCLSNSPRKSAHSPWRQRLQSPWLHGGVSGSNPNEPSTPRSPERPTRHCHRWRP